MSNCTCSAYPFPHRHGGGACDECGCEDAPHCEHWIADVDPFGTGDFWYVEFERRKKRELYTWLTQPNILGKMVSPIEVTP